MTEINRRNAIKATAAGAISAMVPSSLMATAKLTSPADTAKHLFAQKEPFPALREPCYVSANRHARYVEYLKWSKDPHIKDIIQRVASEATRGWRLFSSNVETDDTLRKTHKKLVKLFPKSVLQTYTEALLTFGDVFTIGVLSKESLDRYLPYLPTGHLRPHYCTIGMFRIETLKNNLIEFQLKIANDDSEYPSPNYKVLKNKLENYSSYEDGVIRYSPDAVHHMRLGLNILDVPPVHQFYPYGVSFIERLMEESDFPRCKAFDVREDESLSTQDIKMCRLIEKIQLSMTDMLDTYAQRLSGRDDLCTYMDPPAYWVELSKDKSKLPPEFEKALKNTKKT